MISTLFDRRSESATSSNAPALNAAIGNFRQRHECKNGFLRKSVTDKYVELLDGKNLKRNLDYIDHLLAHRSKANPAEQYRPN